MLCCSGFVIYATLQYGVLVFVVVVILVILLRVEVLYAFPGALKYLPAFTEYEEAQERYWLPVFVRQGHGCYCKFPSARVRTKETMIICKAGGMVAIASFRVQSYCKNSTYTIVIVW